MKIETNRPARTFRVGGGNGIEIRHCADIALRPNEQVTFTTGSGTEFDVVRKTWGYYATPSLNGRLRDHGLRSVLVRDRGTGRAYLLLVEEGQEHAFGDYARADNLELLCWLDTDERVEELASRLGPS